MIWIIILLWIIIDIFRYYYYCKKYIELNKPTKQSCGKSNGIDKFLENIKLYPEMFMENLNDMFYGKVTPEDMKYTDVCESIYFLINKNDTRVMFSRRTVASVPW